MRQRPFLQPPGFPASYLNLPKIKKQGCPITHALKVCFIWSKAKQLAFDLTPEIWSGLLELHLNYLPACAKTAQYSKVWKTHSRREHGCAIFPS